MRNNGVIHIFHAQDWTGNGTNMKENTALE